MGDCPEIMDSTGQASSWPTGAGAATPKLIRDDVSRDLAPSASERNEPPRVSMKPPPWFVKYVCSRTGGEAEREKRCQHC